MNRLPNLPHALKPNPPQLSLLSAIHIVYTPLLRLEAKVITRTGFS